jgi:hypothetical protein
MYCLFYGEGGANINLVPVLHYAEWSPGGENLPNWPPQRPALPQTSGNPIQNPFVFYPNEHWCTLYSMYTTHCFCPGPGTGRIRIHFGLEDAGTYIFCHFGCGFGSGSSLLIGIHWTQVFWTKYLQPRKDEANTFKNNITLKKVCKKRKITFFRSTYV